MVLQMFFLIICEHEINSYNYLLLVKRLTLRSVIILIKSLLNKDKNQYYCNIFLEKCSYMTYYDIIDASKWTDVHKTSKLSMMFLAIVVFLDKVSFKFMFAVVVMVYWWCPQTLIMLLF